MEFVKSPVYIITILLLLVVFAEWLGTKKYFRYLGGVLIVIIAAAIVANVGLIPTTAEAAPIYDGIFTYAGPLGIFFLMLEVKLKDIKHAGLPMISMFCVGAATTIIGTLVGYYLLNTQQQIANSYAVAGMFTGTYIGGSANLNAVALHYGVNKDGIAFAAINAADNIATTIWTVIMIILPPLLQRFIPRKTVVAGINVQSQIEHLESEREAIGVKDLAILLALGFGSLFLSQYLNGLFNKKIPGILILTTIALILAQLRFVQQLKGSRIVGYFLILVFLAVVGAFCDLNALSRSGAMAITIFTWITIVMLIHGTLLFLIGAIFKQDWYVLAIASLANIGGPTSAAAVASSMGRSDLRLPAILVGSIGAAVGTYLGISIAEFLR